MCDPADYFYTSLIERTQRARKEHVCCACRDTIAPGHRYRVTRAVGGHDDPEHYKHCLRCAKMLDAIIEARPEDAIAWDLACGEDWRDTIGELPNDIAALAFMTPEDAQHALGKERP